MSARPDDHEARAAYWEHVYDGKGVADVSWWQPVPALSLRLVEAAGLGPDAPIVDVGAGWSTLVDHLLARGHGDLTAVDLSAAALATMRGRLGAGSAVRTEVADALELDLPRAFALWHDRAVFHFLTEPGERDDYRAAVARSLRPDGWLVVSTFALDGPATCSGLPVVRYSAEALAAEFPGFRLVVATDDDHVTPWGAVQPFTGVLLRRGE